MLVITLPSNLYFSLFFENLIFALNNFTLKVKKLVSVSLFSWKVRDFLTRISWPLKVLIILFAIVIASGVLYVCHSGAFGGYPPVIPGLHTQNLSELTLVSFSYAFGVLGLVIIYNFCRRRRLAKNYDTLLYGALLLLITWLLIHYIYLWVKRG